MRNKRLSYTGIVTAALLMTGCATQQGSVESLKRAAFNYDPITVEAINSAQVKIVMVRPRYNENFNYARIEPYSSFSRSMGNDFEELLIARGYTVDGPYNSHEEIIFSAKEQSDFALAVDIDINVFDTLENIPEEPTFAEILTATYGTEKPDPRYKVKGRISLSGKLIIKVYEPMSGENLWIKNIPINPENFSVISNSIWNDPVSTAIAFRDSAIHNPTAEALERIYQDALSTAYTHLDPRELKQLRPEVERIRAKKRY